MSSDTKANITPVVKTEQTVSKQKEPWQQIKRPTWFFSVQNTEEIISEYLWLLTFWFMFQAVHPADTLPAATITDSAKRVCFLKCTHCTADTTLVQPMTPVRLSQAQEQSKRPKISSKCSLSFIHGRGRRSRTAAAGPWRPGWGRWPDAVALRSRKPRPVWHAVCASSKPDRWWQSEKYPPDSEPAPDLRSASPSLQKTQDGGGWSAEGQRVHIRSEI